MTYFGFLFGFVMLPMFILLAWTLFDLRRGRHLPKPLHYGSMVTVIAAHVLIALIYTTPWDNYLVATGVWWYDLNLVTGITIGWVPIEEYTFFLLQPILSGLWLFTLMRYMPVSNEPVSHNPWLRIIPVAITAVLWLLALVMLLDGTWRYDTYLGLILIWALLPIGFQLGFGAHILWKHRRVVLTAIATATGWLAFADSLAIQSGTWTIDPQQSLPLLLGGVLPIEEFLFFLITTILIVMGVTLMMARESHEMVPPPIMRRLRFLINRQRLREGAV